MWERGRWWQGEVEGVGDRRGIYIVPYTLTFGHYGLAGIRLTALMEGHPQKIEILGSKWRNLVHSEWLI